MSEPFLGELKMIGWGFAPRGWATCDGQLLAIAQYSALFSLLGTTFGGDGRTTFGLPDLRGRDAIHVGTGPGLPQVRWGQQSGSHSVPIGIANMPSHTHTFKPRGSTNGGTQDSPANNFPAEHEAAGDSPYATSGNVDMGQGTTAATGGSSPLTVTEPFLGIYHVIALQGVFPSRN